MNTRKAKGNRVVMIRHAQSEWKQLDRFSGRDYFGASRDVA